MNTLWSRMLSILALLSCAFTCLPQGSTEPSKANEAQAQEPQFEEDSIIGTWYLQFTDNELPDPEEQVRIEFTNKGIVNVYEDDSDKPERMGYSHDQKQSTIKVFDLDDPTDIEVVLKYSFVDDMLILRSKKKHGDGEEDVMELTRNKEGTTRHQELRAKQGEGEGEKASSKQRVRSMTQMRGLHQGAVTLALSRKERMPASLGELIVGDYVSPDYLLAPWSDKEVPEGFGEWSAEKQTEWGNTNTDYVYLGSGRKVVLDAKLVLLFELPAGESPETVNLLFDDSHVEAMEYEEADKLIKKQTGHSLAEWKKTTSPGTGQLVLPKEENGEDNAEAKQEGPAQ